MNRKTYIDYMRAFAILLVIAGHANAFNDPVKTWIYSFHIAGVFHDIRFDIVGKKTVIKISRKESPGIAGSIYSLGITVFIVDTRKCCEDLLWKLSIHCQCRIINIIVVFADNVYCLFYFTDFDKNQKECFTVFYLIIGVFLVGCYPAGNKRGVSMVYQYWFYSGRLYFGRLSDKRTDR